MQSCRGDHETDVGLAPCSLADSLTELYLNLIIIFKFYLLDTILEVYVFSATGTFLVCHMGIKQTERATITKS